MTDARRRELGRGQDLESEARALVEAVRAGELAQADLDLAADLGDARAGLATGRPARPLADLCAGLAAGPRRLAAACALGELAFPAWCFPLRVEPLGGEWVGEGVEALRAARDRGAPVERARASNAHEAAYQRDADVLELGALAARVVALACEAAAAPSPRRPSSPSLGRAARLAAGLLGEAEVRAALARALLPRRLRPPAPAEPPGWCREADHLRRRLASGASSRAGLELVHRLGHAEASAALDLAPVTSSPGAAWVASLDPAAPLTHEVAVRTLLGCARSVISAAPTTPAGRALRAVAAWCVAPPGQERLALAADALHASQVTPLAVEQAPLQVVRGIFGAPSAPDTGVLELAARACGASPREARELLATGATRMDAHDLADALRRDVAPWLLGYLDPLAELQDG